MNDQDSGCPSISDLEDYRSGSADGEAARRVASHLESCAGCRDQIVELKRLDGLSAKLRSAAPAGM